MVSSIQTQSCPGGSSANPTHAASSSFSPVAPQHISNTRIGVCSHAQNNTGKRIPYDESIKRQTKDYEKILSGTPFSKTGGQFELPPIRSSNIGKNSCGKSSGLKPLQPIQPRPKGFMREGFKSFKASSRKYSINKGVIGRVFNNCTRSFERYGSKYSNIMNVPSLLLRENVPSDQFKTHETLLRLGIMDSIHDGVPVSIAPGEPPVVDGAGQRPAPDAPCDLT